MAEIEKENKPEKKKKKSLGLSARQSFKRQRQMNRMRNNRAGVSELIGFIFLAFIIIFILSGGVNQRKFFEWCGRTAHNVGETVSSWFDPNKLKVTDDGIYFDGSQPDGAQELPSAEDRAEQ